MGARTESAGSPKKSSKVSYPLQLSPQGNLIEERMNQNPDSHMEVFDPATPAARAAGNSLLQTFEDILSDLGRHVGHGVRVWVP